MTKFGHEILTSEFPDDDGSVDQEFYQLDVVSLARLQRERLTEIAAEYLEDAVEASGYKDAKNILKRIALQKHEEFCLKHSFS